MIFLQGRLCLHANPPKYEYICILTGILTLLYKQYTDISVTQVLLQSTDSMQ